jgi:signal transduction histidine kinase
MNLVARILRPKDPSRILTETVEKLSLASSLPELTGIVAEAARTLTGAEGATFVLRDEGKCYYADEHAISPLWKGKRFPLEACISGWSMLHREVVVIRDIYKDPRIPVDAYRPTFVKSLCMVPIREADPIGAIGNYWASERVPTDEEIKLLQTLANSSAVALENLELKETVHRRNAERTGFENRKKELEAALYSLAHDLRSPIATMMGMSELLQMHLEEKAGGALDLEAKQFLESIAITGERACRQMERMLALYKASNQTLRKQPLDLTAVARELMDQLKVQAPERQIDFYADPALGAKADPDLTRLMLENLFSNAIKYSGKKPSVWIAFGKKDESARERVFFVQDRGDGFDPSQASLLFKPLVRLHKDTEFAGTWLGLASVAQIVELHGGRIWAEGKKHEGATFYFTMPTD